MRCGLFLLFASMLVVIAFGPALAQNETKLGAVPRYGGQWRYNYGDRSGLYRLPNPGVCWTWVDRFAEWVWTC